MKRNMKGAKVRKNNIYEISYFRISYVLWKHEITYIVTSYA